MPWSREKRGDWAILVLLPLSNGTPGGLGVHILEATGRIFWRWCGTTQGEGMFQILPRAPQGCRPHLRAVLFRGHTCASQVLRTHPAILSTNSEAGAKPSREVGGCRGTAEQWEQAGRRLTNGTAWGQPGNPRGPQTTM